jgi:hypothetical protein
MSTILTEILDTDFHISFKTHNVSDAGSAFILSWKREGGKQGIQTSSL